MCDVMLKIFLAIDVQPIFLLYCINIHRERNIFLWQLHSRNLQVLSLIIKATRTRTATTGCRDQYLLTVEDYSRSKSGILPPRVPAALHRYVFQLSFHSSWDFRRIHSSLFILRQPGNFANQQLGTPAAYKQGLP